MHTIIKSQLSKYNELNVIAYKLSRRLVHQSQLV